MMAIQHTLQLTPEEQAMLRGEDGIAVQRAIEIVVALARIYGARRLVPIASVQVAGVSYKNLGQAGLDFLHEWAEQGARVCVPTTLNPAGTDTERWQALGIDPAFARQQQAVIEAYTAMGISPTCTCTPYLVGNVPQCGEHVAWAESSAVSFVNSVLGAYTNREGGPSALAAAITGRTAAYGLHLDELRMACYRVDVHCPVESVSDWGALGYEVGRQVQTGVPYFFLHDSRCSVPNPAALNSDPMVDRLKALGAALAASGAVALFHVHQVTPEARQVQRLRSDALHIRINDLQAGYLALDTGPREIDLVSIGCPHASTREVALVAEAVSGRRLKAALWLTTARGTRESMHTEVGAIEAAGGKVIADTCLVVAPMEQLGFRTLATNSAKMATYAPTHSGVQVRFGTLAQCVDAALSGQWPDRTQA